MSSLEGIKNAIFEAKDSNGDTVPLFLVANAQLNSVQI